jgi:hypothetical protein
MGYLWILQVIPLNYIPMFFFKPPYNHSGSAWLAPRLGRKKVRDLAVPAREFLIPKKKTRTGEND